MFDPREKIALFIDGANLYATAKALGFDIDYKKLLHEFQREGLSAARLLLYGSGGRSGIFLDPPADRLARLQRLYGGHQADQGIRRRNRPAQDQGQHGHRARCPCHGNGSTTSTISSSSPAMATSARWSRPSSARAARSASSRRLSSQPPMIADELRRQADHFVDLLTPAGQDRPRPVRARAAPEPSAPSPPRSPTTTSSKATTPSEARRSGMDTTTPGRDCPLCPGWWRSARNGATGSRPGTMPRFRPSAVTAHAC